MTTIPRRSVAALACGVLILGACGGDADGGSAEAHVEQIFELPSNAMSADDAAALIDPENLTAPDPMDLGKGTTPGVVYGVWDPDRGRFTAAGGVADIEGGTAMTTDLSFRIGDITKTFTATAVLLLVDDGKVDLDESVATYTGDLTAALPGGDTATVRDLLGMTSGWPAYSDDPAGPVVQQLGEPDHEFTAEELVAAAAVEAPTAVGEVADVNTNFIVLGRLIENVSGSSFSEFVESRILDPVGLENTIIPDPTVTAPVTTHGYLNAGWAAFGSADVPDDVTSVVSAGDDVTELSSSVVGSAGNGVSTLQDLAIWAAADFGNVLLSDSSREARLAGSPADNIVPTSEYGLGLQIFGDWHGHGGEIFGWESLVLANPPYSQVAVVSANACCGLGGDLLGFVATAFPDDPMMTSLVGTITGDG